MKHPVPFLIPVLAVLLSGGCNDKGAAPVSVFPAITSYAVRPNPHNAISAIVEATLTDAVLARVDIHDGVSFVPQPHHVEVSGSRVTLPVLGLEPGRRYICRVAALSTDMNEAHSPEFEIVTDSLPHNLPRLSVAVNAGPTPGYVMLVGPSTDDLQKHYAYIIDNTGRIVWYRAFTSSMLDFQKQPDGSYTAFSSLVAPPGQFYQMDNLGNVVREYRSLAVPETGPHELRLRNDGHILFGIEYRTMDLTDIGGQAVATVRGLTVEYNKNSGENFIWNAFDHFSVADALPDISLAGPNVNPWHGNAIDVDTDGHLLVSWRSLGEITKINSITGAIIWRLGGRNNQFTFVNDPLNGFSHQHGIRRLPNGNIILFDNGNVHTPPASRGVEYRLNESMRTAELVWEFRPNPPISSPILGFAQRLPNGNTLVCFGRAQRIMEVTASGAVVWDVRVETPGNYPYRALRIETLY